MNKVILTFALLAVCASAYYQVDAAPQPSPKDFVALFSGFNDQLAIATDDELNKCAKVPLIADLNKTFHDLNATTPNPIALTKDVMNIYNDYHKIQEYCPKLEKTYEDFFAPVRESFQKNPAVTLLRIGKNVAHHLVGITKAATRIPADFAAENYYSAGQDFGTVVSLVLTGFI